MQRHHYRCNKCLVIEETQGTEDGEPSSSIPCPRCAGLGIRIPASRSLDRLFAAGSRPIVSSIDPDDAELSRRANRVSIGDR